MQRMPSPLLFYFDFVSPYAYLAATQVPALAARHGRELTMVPVVFAKLLDAHGTVGPAEVPAKRIYVFKDAWRKARRLGLGPLVPPPSHPFNPLLALRVATLPMESAEKVRLVRALFDATWKSGSGVDTEERVVAAAASAGFDGAALVQNAQAPDNKERLKTATAEAVKLGIFGVPTLVVEGEIFWGIDGLELAEDLLAGRDDTPKDFSWAERPATAQRPGRFRRP